MGGEKPVLALLLCPETYCEGVIEVVDIQLLQVSVGRIKSHSVKIQPQVFPFHSLENDNQCASILQLGHFSDSTRINPSGC